MDRYSKSSIVIDPSGNARNLPKEISYQGIKYWLRLLQSPTIKLLGFLMDNAPKEHSIQEIAEGTNLEEDTLSRLLPSLEKSQKIVASHKNEVKTYKLNMQNREIIGLMDIMGLRRIN